jgi:hypothetical protein
VLITFRVESIPSATHLDLIKRNVKSNLLLLAEWGKGSRMLVRDSFLHPHMKRPMLLSVYLEPHIFSFIFSGVIMLSPNSLVHRVTFVTIRIQYHTTLLCGQEELCNLHYMLPMFFCYIVLVSKRCCQFGRLCVSISPSF